jgi:MerR family copper efflux transcriptional regulator/MerR family gold-responsive transcriptional activator of gol and ges genes
MLKENKMNIGELSKETGVSTKLIRHYEEIGLIPKAARSTSGYRKYSDNDVYVLRFIKRGRNLGFPMKEIKQLLGLWRNKGRSSKDVKALALSHLKNLDRKIHELQEMAETLRHLAKNCHGDNRPGCPIIDSLEYS